MLNLGITTMNNVIIIDKIARIATPIIQAIEASLFNTLIRAPIPITGAKITVRIIMTIII